MRPLVLALVTSSLSLCAVSTGQTAPSTRHRALSTRHGALTATGVIRGRIDVRVPARPAELRPDPGNLGMAGPHEPLDRRRSVVYLETAPRAAFEVSDERRARMNQRNEQLVPHVL